MELLLLSNMGAIIQLFWQYLRIRAQEPVFLGMWQLGKRLDAACKFLSNYMCQLSFMVTERGLWIRQLYCFNGECIKKYSSKKSSVDICELDGCRYFLKAHVAGIFKEKWRKIISF